jgi:hypothetical protein
MTFEEAGQQFANLQAQVHTGQLQAVQFQQMAAQLRVQDPSGNWWQIDPNSAQWMMWNGTQWTWPQPQARPAAPQPAYPQPAYAAQRPAIAQPAPLPPQTAPQSRLTVQKKKAAPAIWEGLAPVLPGLAIGLMQGWPMYSKNTAMLVGFVVPSLLPAVLVPLVPYVGRTVAIIVVVGCLGWLSWPILIHLSSMLGNSQAVQAQAGRGLVGVSLIYLIPRIWQMK